MAGSKDILNSAQKPYPAVVYYGLKAIQLTISVVFGATSSYLLYELMNDHREVLGTFFFVSDLLFICRDHLTNPSQLAAVAFLSIIIVTTTTFVFWFAGLRSPYITVIISLILTAMWAGNVVALSNHVSGTINSPCDLVHWNGSTGIAICKLYRALLGITIVALYVFSTSIYFNR